MNYQILSVKFQFHFNLVMEVSNDEPHYAFCKISDAANIYINQRKDRHQIKYTDKGMQRNVNPLNKKEHHKAEISVSPSRRLSRRIPGNRLARSLLIVLSPEMNCLHREGFAPAWFSSDGRRIKSNIFGRELSF